MNTIEAAMKAEELMQHHGLVDKGWTFQWDEAHKRFGMCQYRPRIISLSRPLVQLNRPEDVIDTIKHEIAHAIAGAKAGHGFEWKLVAMQIGAAPRRCADANVIVPEGKIIGICAVGCKAQHNRERMPKRPDGWQCRRCGHKIRWERNVGQRRDEIFVPAVEPIAAETIIAPENPIRPVFRYERADKQGRLF